MLHNYKSSIKFHFIHTSEILHSQGLRTNGRLKKVLCSVGCKKLDFVYFVQRLSNLITSSIQSCFFSTLKLKQDWCGSWSLLKYWWCNYSLSGNLFLRKKTHSTISMLIFIFMEFTHNEWDIPRNYASMKANLKSSSSDYFAYGIVVWNIRY